MFTAAAVFGAMLSLWWNVGMWLLMGAATGETLPVIYALFAETMPAAVFHELTPQSSGESGSRADYEGYKRDKDSKVHMAVDTLGHLLAVHVTPVNEQERTLSKTAPLSLIEEDNTF